MLTKQQQFICQNLFPTYTEIKKFDSGPIPYRVLKEAKTAQEHFKHGLYILHEAPAQMRDPILVGAKREYYHWYNGTDKYNGLSLIARWGDALDSWEELYKKAAAIFREKNRDFLKALKMDVEHAIALIDQGIMPTNASYNPETLHNLLPFSK